MFTTVQVQLHLSLETKLKLRVFALLWTQYEGGSEAYLALDFFFLFCFGWLYNCNSLAECYRHKEITCIFQKTSFTVGNKICTISLQCDTAVQVHVCILNRSEKKANYTCMYTKHRLSVNFLVVNINISDNMQDTVLYKWNTCEVFAKRNHLFN